jgi:hypothetical protein
MNSVTTMRKMDNKSPMNNIANSTQYKGSKLTYKLNDIFLGFNEDDNNLEIDKKTLKLVNST